MPAGTVPVVDNVRQQAVQFSKGKYLDWSQTQINKQHVSLLLKEKSSYEYLILETQIIIESYKILYL